MVDFSVSCDSIASLFIFVRIRFKPCNDHYLAAFVLPGPAVTSSGKIFFFITVICLLTLSLAV